MLETSLVLNNRMRSTIGLMDVEIINKNTLSTPRTITHGGDSGFCSSAVF
ncbi:hypothetical protein VDIAB_100354 [Vibrio diabolicus]|nr:hypothetical protein VDIAB_100354 [Vibrio diabolicus]